MPRKNRAPAPEELASSMGDMITARRKGQTPQQSAMSHIQRENGELRDDNRRLRLEVMERDTKVERADATVALAREFVEHFDRREDVDAKVREFVSSFREVLKAVVGDDEPTELEAHEAERGAA